MKIIEVNRDKPLKPIAELVSRPDFPESAVGEFVDIGGYTGEVVGIVHNAIRVKAPEGATRGFNIHVLRKLYGPRLEEPPPPPLSAPAEEPDQAETQAAAPPQIAEPNFEQEVKLISHLVSRADFPECALGQH